MTRRAAFAYKGSGAALVKRMKFGDRPELAQILARLIYSRTGDVLPRHALFCVGTFASAAAGLATV
jgi:predicted amidophosphoribosyltransferase